MPTIERFRLRDLGPRDWGQEVLIAHTEQYIGKILTMRAGTQGGLQYHRVKMETFFLFSGEAIIITNVPDRAEPTLRCEPMYAGEAYHIPAGAIHQVQAVTDCVFFEVSTPHFDDRVRVEAEYGLPETGGLPTTDAPSDDTADNHCYWGV
jgi:mannose-6-phosphate isomerase-like protein (cupin superfamily)